MQHEIFLVVSTQPTCRRLEDDMEWTRMETKLDLAWFTRQLRTVLISLFDPSVIRHSPLAELFEVVLRHNPMFALQYIILNAIEALKPNESMPASSRNCLARLPPIREPVPAAAMIATFIRVNNE